MRKQIKKYNQKESTPTKNKSSLKFVNLGTYTSPVISEEQNKNFVKYGQDNDYYGYLLDLFNGSPTNSGLYSMEYLHRHLFEYLLSLLYQKLRYLGLRFPNRN